MTGTACISHHLSFNYVEANSFHTLYQDGDEEAEEAESQKPSMRLVRAAQNPKARFPISFFCDAGACLSFALIGIAFRPSGLSARQNCRAFPAV